MNFLRLLMGRRQFLSALAAPVAVAAAHPVEKILGIAKRPGVAMASEAASKPKLKGLVVYYSATGSTGKIAGAIHRGMKAVMDCDVAPVKKIDPKTLAKYDVVAIGGPIWYYRETANLRLFVYNMPSMEGKLCIPFCTHGTNPDGFFFSLSTHILKKGFSIIGWNDWYGGCSHVLHQPSPYFTDGHPDAIDLAEAETFGREMAEKAQRIFAGEKGLIPVIPSGADADSLWIQNGYEGGGGPSGGMGGMPGGMSGGEAGGMPAGAGGAAMGAGGAPAGGATGGMPGGSGGGPGGGGGGPQMPGNANALTMTPDIDLTKCVYPKCTTCMDVCLVNAIDLSMAVPGVAVSNSKLLIKTACLHCSHPLCEKGCAYDAIFCDNGTKTQHVFDMTKCTYPKCTLCIDNCPMDSIDVTQRPFHVKNNCEGCDVCWCVCPENAISIPNIESTHARLTPSSAEDAFFAALNKAEKTGKFRRLTPLDKIGWNNIVYKNPKAPRVVLKPENYPYDVNG